GNKSPQQAAREIGTQIKNTSNEIRDQLTLGGTWTSNCQEPSIFAKLSMQVSKSREQYHFSGNSNDFSKKTIYYSDETCTQHVFVLQEKGHITIQGATTPKEGVPIDLEFTNVTLQPASESAKKELETVNFCGIGNWQVGYDTDVTAQSSKVAC